MIEWFRFYTSLFCFLMFSCVAGGQNPTPSAEPIVKTLEKTTDRVEALAQETVKEATSPEEEQVIKNLIQVTSRILEIRQSLQRLQKNPRGKSGKEFEDRKNELQLELSSLVANFESMATRVPEEELPQKRDLKMNWSDAISEITKPLLFAVQDISDKPRKIDLLKAKVQALENQLQRFMVAENHLMALALNDLQKAGDRPVSRSVEAAYREELKLLRQKYDPELIRLKLEETRRSLTDIESSRNSVLEAFAITVVDFFRVRGKNLLISFFTFLCVWGLLNWVYRFIANKTPLLLKIRPSYRKAISAVWSVLFLATAFFSGLLALYLQNDWLLLSVLLLSIVGIAWASRQLIPQFVSEIRAVMNLGSIREKERVIWQGVPFYVGEMGFFVTLENPALEGGQLHLPIGKLLNQYSRPVAQSEKWFPTETGDWVILSDGVYGQVTVQTVEQVILEVFGAEKYYPTTQFLQLNPRNLSSGYTHNIRFGLDYSEQAKVTEEMPRIFRQEMLNQLMAKFGGNFKKLALEFDSAGESSLMLMARVTFGPNMGAEYFITERYINRLMVEVCNRHGLTIPFKQLTLNWAASTEIPVALSGVKTKAADISDAFASLQRHELSFDSTESVSGPSRQND